VPIAMSLADHLTDPSQCWTPTRARATLRVTQSPKEESKTNHTFFSPFQLSTTSNVPNPPIKLHDGDRRGIASRRSR
jgi:hypothetical protein